MNELEGDYDTFAKDLAWTAYWEAHQQVYGVEKTKPIDRRTAKHQFEQWWERNI